VVGAACFVASIGYISSVKTALFQPVLSVSPAQFSWIGNVNLGISHETAAPAPLQTPDLGALVVTHVDQELKKIAKLESRAKLERRKAFTHLARAKTHPKPAVELAEGVKAQSDLVQTSQAASSEYIPAPELTEEEKLRQIHFALMSRFKVAMNDLAPASVTMQLAQAVDTQPTSEKSHSDFGLDSVPEAPEPKKPHRAPAVILAATKTGDESSENKADETAPKTSSEKPEQLAPAAAAVAAAALTPTTQLSAAKLAAADQLGDRLAGGQEILPPPSSDEPVRPIAVTTTTQSQAPPSSPALASPTLDGVPPAATQTIVVHPAQAAAPAAVAASAPAKSETVSVAGTTFVLPAEYPAAQPARVASGYSQAGNLAKNTHSQQPAAILPSPHTGQDSAMTDSDEIVHHQASALMSAAAPSELEAVVPSLSAPRPAVPLASSFIEAFDWAHSVSDAQTEILTREDAFESYGHAQVGWRIGRAADHWPTVYWNRGGEVPLLSKNSAKMLSLRAATSLQSEAGIVIAKVPAGWSLEFSGRSEHPLVFNTSNQLLANDTVEEERYYVFLNASPGAQILYLVKSGETGALALPVFGGMLSYADMSNPQKQELSGVLLDASGTSARGILGMRVQLIGSGQTTVSSGTGMFHLENVVSFGSHPLYLEAELNHGYPHRYKINPQSNKHSKLRLFVISDEQVHEWLGQLEGGISTESGLVVAAIPSVASAYEDKKPIPSIKTLAIDPTLQPETYTVSPAGQLQVKTPMNGQNSRLVGVQVPEGPAVVQLTDKDGKVLWSELLVISPRVLSIVGPY
jgi:hypothetical protein